MIYCLDIMITAVYVGQTTNLTNRTVKHKSRCNNPNDKKHNLYVYRYIREHGGWNNWNIRILETANLNNRDEARILEHKWYVETESTLNTQHPLRNMRQYQIDNADKIKQYYKEYNIKNADKRKQYRIDNADKRKQYRIDNADKLRKQQQEYYQKHKKNKII